ncbi:hypothetical protein [Amycolatopsis balhimycina]|uniref:hypothetical protein n=1 Tax=Amycolatopsis balhimycina TaxID=208443 RepID=UPI000368FA9A|nr:hypothetical protein [Amycolatopsis balhimycina]
MHARDRELLAGLSKMNSRIGSVTVELLTLQANDARYAAALRTLARQLAQVGAALARRASELDDGDIDLVNLLDAPSEDAQRLNGAG